MISLIANSLSFWLHKRSHIFWEERVLSSTLYLLCSYFLLMSLSSARAELRKYSEVTGPREQLSEAVSPHCTKIPMPAQLIVAGVGQFLALAWVYMLSCHTSNQPHVTSCCHGVTSKYQRLALPCITKHLCLCYPLSFQIHLPLFVFTVSQLAFWHHSSRMHGSLVCDLLVRIHCLIPVLLIFLSLFIRRYLTNKKKIASTSTGISGIKCYHLRYIFYIRDTFYKTEQTPTEDAYG